MDGRAQVPSQTAERPNVNATERDVTGRIFVVYSRGAKPEFSGLRILGITFSGWATVGLTVYSWVGL